MNQKNEINRQILRTFAAVAQSQQFSVLHVLTPHYSSPDSHILHESIYFRVDSPP